METVLMVVLMVGVVGGLLVLLSRIEKRLDAWEDRITDAESEDD